MASRARTNLNCDQVRCGSLPNWLSFVFFSLVAALSFTFAEAV